MIKQATRPELGCLERSDARAEQGETVTRSPFQKRFTGFAEIRHDYSLAYHINAERHGSPELSDVIGYIDRGNAWLTRIFPALT
jgi:hypothetical protein